MNNICDLQMKKGQNDFNGVEKNIQDSNGLTDSKHDEEVILPSHYTYFIR